MDGKETKQKPKPNRNLFQKKKKKERKKKATTTTTTTTTATTANSLAGIRFWYHV
jgi:hypothetical protein